MINIKVVKKVSYWLYCPECGDYVALETLKEAPVNAASSKLECVCGYEFPQIQLTWTFYEERRCQLDCKEVEFISH